MADAEKYTCPLSQLARKVAKEELREDEETVNFALEQMRDWIKKNPRIIACRTGKKNEIPTQVKRNRLVSYAKISKSCEIIISDNSFLLRFLRCKKFSLPIAEETLERYLLLRHVYGDLMFHNLDVKDPTMDALIDTGYTNKLHNSLF